MRDFISKKSIGALSDRIKSQYSDFNQSQFKKDCLYNIESLSLNERLNQVKDSLATHLPKDFKKSALILKNATQEELDHPNQDETNDGGFINLSQCNYIASYGQDYFVESMQALEVMTERFSAEGAIRSFITNHPVQTMNKLKKWIKSDNYHIRRLVSEGTRPRLPWFTRLPQFIEDPKPVIALLEQLKDDDELYVRRSVANNLNDIAKDNPKDVTNLLEKWVVDASPERMWVIKHALRSLIKQGNKEALSIIGFKTVKNIVINEFKLDKDKMKMGEKINISLDLTSFDRLENKLLIDYVVYHKKANGSLAPKVFKWTQKTISKDSPLHINKSHSIREISTRKYYTGLHEIHLQINGDIVAKTEFYLTV